MEPMPPIFVLHKIHISLPGQHHTFRSGTTWEVGPVWLHYPLVLSHSTCAESSRVKEPVSSRTWREQMLLLSEKSVVSSFHFQSLRWKQFVEMVSVDPWLQPRGPGATFTKQVSPPVRGHDMRGTAFSCSQKLILTQVSSSGWGSFFPSGHEKNISFETPWLISNLSEILRGYSHIKEQMHFCF